MTKKLTLEELRAKRQQLYAEVGYYFLHNYDSLQWDGTTSALANELDRLENKIYKLEMANGRST